jgi:hypothetical protein
MGEGKVVQKDGEDVYGTYIAHSVGSRNLPWRSMSSVAEASVYGHHLNFGSG